MAAGAGWLIAVCGDMVSAGWGGAGGRAHVHAAPRLTSASPAPLCFVQMMIPGLPTRPAYYEIDIDPATGRVLGLS